VGPTDGSPVGGPLPGHGSWVYAVYAVYAVAAVPLRDGRVLLASGGGDGRCGYGTDHFRHPR